MSDPGRARHGGGYKNDGIEAHRLLRLAEARCLTPLPLPTSAPIADRASEREALEAALAAVAPEPALSPDALLHLCLLCEALTPELLGPDHLALLLPRLPRLPLLEQGPAFALLELLSQNAALAAAILECGFLRDLDFADLPRAPADLIGAVCSVLFRVISRVPDAAPLFKSSFFPALYATCMDDCVWGQSGLAYVIRLAAQFLPLIDDGEILGRFLTNLIIRFIHHTDDRIQIPALEAAVILLRAHPELAGHYEFSDDRLYDRLSYLGGQGNAPLTEAVICLFQALLELLRDFSPQAWGFVVGCIEASIQSSETRLEGLILLQTVVAYPGFAALGVLPEVMGAVFGRFEEFRAKEKLAVGAVIANILGYWDLTARGAVLADERFIDVIVACLGMDEDEAAENLLNGLHAGLRSVGESLPADVRELLAEAVAGVLECENEQTRRVAECVLRLLS
jgi:hypothetical protein